MLHISLPAEIIFHLDSFPVTNSLLVTVLLTFLLLLVSFLSTRKVARVPSGWQNFLEMVIEAFWNLTESVAGKKAQRFFPLVFTFFLFIILGNWSGLIPGFASLGFWEMKEGRHVLVPLFRGATADLNTTLALALVSVVAIQYYGFRQLKLPYLKRFFDFKNPIKLFVGILELLSDFAKVISFSFRLFGNIFAGEVLLLVTAFLTPLVVPVPFLLLEIFVGFIQAFIFAMLTLVFLNVATAEEGH